MSLKCEVLEYAERESSQAARVKHRKWHKNKVSIKDLKDDYCPKRATLPY